MKPLNKVGTNKGSMNKTSALILILVCLMASSWVNAAGVGNTIAVRLVGTGAGYDGNQLFKDHELTEVDAVCFDVDLVDIKTGNVIGTASDCLSDITPNGDGLELIGTTFFFFPGGTLVSQGMTTVQPVLHGSTAFTHITGAVPLPSENGVVYGDGKFKNANGPVRLSGAVNLNSLAGGLITFDCVFIIDI